MFNSSRHRLCTILQTPHPLKKPSYSPPVKTQLAHVCLKPHFISLWGKTYPPLIKMRADKRKLKIRILAECRLQFYKKVQHVMIHRSSISYQSVCLRRQFEKLKDKKRTNYVLAFRTLKIYAVFLSLKVYCSESVQIVLAIGRHQSDSQKPADCKCLLSRETQSTHYARDSLNPESTFAKLVV